MKIGLALLLILSMLVGCQDQGLPTRQECIVEISLEWDEKLGRGTREQLINDISAVIASFGNQQGSDPGPIQQAMSRDDRTQIYLQFSKNCDARFEVAQQIIEAVTNAVPNAPLMEVSNRIVQPGYDTINVWGPYWRDRPVQ